MDEEKPCFVPAMRGRGKGSAPRLVALQVRDQMEVCCSGGQQSGGQTEEVGAFDEGIEQFGGGMFVTPPITRPE
ncbi:hypothetical protein Scep_012264 [Stephania cephalantha]|uniref:Uncharacterized protein n=1 Tax=Stephania cephalantha TaxID=152367 RepID=A0AAP0JG93_9MAGN